MRYPEFLEINDTVGFVAPSFGCAIQPYKTGFERFIERLENMNYKTKLGPNVYSDCGVGISNTPKKCGEELTSMYCQPDNKILISCGGGELMCETLEYTDFDKIKNAKPKWYLGYSDNTNFTFLQTTICDTAAVYGPCAATFGMDEWHKSLQDTFDVLTGTGFVKSQEGFLEKEVSGYDLWEKESLKSEDNPTPCFNLTEEKKLTVFNGYESTLENVSFEGRLVGGCLDCLVNLLGTRYDNVSAFNDKYADDKIIWFIESCDLNVFSIRRAFWQMENAGWFKNVAGFMIGRPLCMGQEMMGLNQYSAVKDIVGKYNVPIVMDCDFGHISPVIPMISGAYAKAGVSDGNIYLRYVFK